MNKPAPSKKLQEIKQSLGARWVIVLTTIQKAETEGRITKAKADELRGMLK